MYHWLIRCTHVFVIENCTTSDKNNLVLTLIIYDFTKQSYIYALCRLPSSIVNRQSLISWAVVFFLDKTLWWPRLRRQFPFLSSHVTMEALRYIVGKYSHKFIAWCLKEFFEFRFRFRLDVMRIHEPNRIQMLV